MFDYQNINYVNKWYHFFYKSNQGKNVKNKLIIGINLAFACSAWLGPGAWGFLTVKETILYYFRTFSKYDFN